MSDWQIWLVLALLLFVAEMFAPGFWLISVGLGALVAAGVGLVLPNFILEFEALKDMVTSPQSNKVVYMPYEATAMLSSLGGIRDMLMGGADKKS